MPRPRIASDGPIKPKPSPCSAVKLASTADYHSSLFEQSRQQQRLHEQEAYLEQQKLQGKTGSRHWLSSSKTDSEAVEHHVLGGGKSQSPKKGSPKKKRCHGTQLSNEGITRQALEEFEALPTAIRRKYFSTLERLRFAQTSGILQEDVENTEERSSRNHNPRDGHDKKVAPLYCNTTVSADCLSVSKLKEDKNLTRDEQVALVRQLRASVILDAADEAIYKIGRRASKHTSPPAYTPNLTTTPAMEARDRQPQVASVGADVDREVRDSIYDSFRWLDEEDDLDLSLVLDDYHANLRENLPSPTKERRPSFCRHLSITKIPFGRSSMSSSRPATKDATSLPTSPHLVSHQHARRRSRTLSLITPKHTPQHSISSIDPAATHYQDPEARLKLRVYLASPQKFDEAIEFGFPSHDAVSPPPRMSESKPVRPRHSRRMLSDDSAKLKTFLADDNSSTYSEDVSMADPDSPKTPQTLDKHAVKPHHHLPTDDSHLPYKGSDSYAQAPAHSREMTLRMTLTRPDLRACEDQMYGWQRVAYQPTTKLLHSSPLRDDFQNTAMYIGDMKHKESFDRIFASLDEQHPQTGTDGSVMKRIWNRVRRN